LKINEPRLLQLFNLKPKSKVRKGREIDAVNTPGIVPDRILQLGHAFWGAKAVLSAVELDVFTALNHGPLSLDALTSKVGVAERGARDFFDALVALGMLERASSGRYSNTPETALYLDREKSTYIGGALELLNARQFRPWASLTEALRTGKPQSDARGRENYSAYYGDSSVLENVVKGMTGATRQVAKAIAERFPWCDYNSVIDVGTAQGCLPVQIAQTHLHIAAGGFDLPPIKPWFERYVEERGLAYRVRFYPGDFFQEHLPSTDVLVMGRVLHNWDLVTKKMLLKKAYEALPRGGALIIYERLIDDGRRFNAVGLLGSLNMLVMTAGGFDFTGADCIDWMQEAGFRNMRVEPLTTDQSMIIGNK
jgi:hypothetical protein